MFYGEFREKDVVSIRDCRKLGHVIDFEFDACSGCICKIIVADRRGLFDFFCCDKDAYHISFHNIKQIGPDIILVDC